MAFVLDASVALGWVAAKQATPYSRSMRLRARREPYHAPALWRLEVVNAVRALDQLGKPRLGVVHAHLVHCLLLTSQVER